MKRVPRPSKLRPTVDLIDAFRSSDDAAAVILTRGEDFDCAASTAAQVVREEWRRHYGDLTVTNTDDQVMIVVDQGRAQRS